jgi:hypothetical protein
VKARYRSRFEARVHKAAPAAEYETVKVRFVQPAKARTYTPDFKLPSGVLVESKGRFTTADRQKMVWVRDQNPDLDIRILFMNARVPIRKGSKTSYGDWASANGFEWSEGTIPADW